MRYIAIFLAILLAGCVDGAVKPVGKPGSIPVSKPLCKLTESDWQHCRQIAEDELPESASGYLRFKKNPKDFYDRSGGFLGTRSFVLDAPSPEELERRYKIYWQAVQECLRGKGYIVPKVPLEIEYPQDCVSAVAGTEQQYTNPRHKWSISYPDTWKLDDSNLDHVKILSSTIVGLCGVHSSSVRFATVGEFADSMLNYARNTFEARGSKHEVVSRTGWSLTDGVPVVDVIVDIVPGGRSRQVFVLRDGTGIVIDCENYAKNWHLFKGRYDKIISSFKLE